MIHRTYFILPFLLSISISVSSCNGQNPSRQIKTSENSYSKEIEKEIALFENSLSNRILINGKGENIVKRMSYYNIKGLSIAVVNNYEVRWAKGYGIANENDQTPVTTKTLFKSGSISKSLNAMAVLKLIQENKLTLNTDINEYLKSWKFPYDSISHGKIITINHLLSHTAGLSVEGGFLGYDTSQSFPTIPEILDGKGTTPAVRSLFEPGTKFSYSGGGTLITQLILTDITHQPYEKILQETVLNPLGMTNSFFSVTPPKGDLLRKIAIGYSYNGFKAERLFCNYPEQASLGLWTTPSELCYYIIETQLAYKGKSSKVLNQEMTQLRLLPASDASSALGFFIEKRGSETYFMHDGRHGGFCGIFYGSLESGNGVAIMINSDDNSIFDEIINSVATVYQWKNFYTPITKYEIVVDSEILQQYVGIYKEGNKFTTIIKKQDGYYFWKKGKYLKMHFSAANSFYTQESPEDKKFLADASGNITGYAAINGRNDPLNTVKISDPSGITAPASELNDLVWHLVETKQVLTALDFSKRAVALYPGDLSAVIVLAHCYLFSGEYDKAIKLYRDNFNKETAPNMYFKTTIQYHFAFLKKQGYDQHLMEKVFADLNLEIPEFYRNVK